MTKLPAGDMTARERTLRASRQEAVDGPPVWFDAPSTVADSSAAPRAPDPERAAGAAARVVEELATDAAVLRVESVPLLMALGWNPGASRPQAKDSGRPWNISPCDPDVEAPWVAGSVRRLREALGRDVGVVGSTPGPWSLATALLDGAGSWGAEDIRGVACGDERDVLELLETLVDALIPVLGVQVESGADALILREESCGDLARESFMALLAAPLERLLATSKSLGVAVILAVDGGLHLLEALADLGPSMLGIDWRIDPNEARQRLGARVGLLGNLDPAALHAPRERLRQMTNASLDAFGKTPGHIFSLGGPVPAAPIDRALAEVVAVVQERRRGAS